MIKLATALTILLAPALASSCMPEAPRPAGYVYQCPPLQQYSDAQQKRALAELKAVEGKVPTVKEMLNDFSRLRNACRVIAKVEP
jgi:hypothetical protein